MSDEHDVLVRRERGEPVDGDFSKYERIEGALGDRSSAARAPAGFEDRLWAAVDRAEAGEDDGEEASRGGADSRRSRMAVWGGLAAVAAAIALFVVVRGRTDVDPMPGGDRLSVTVERGAQVMRGGQEAQPGDRLRVAARAADAGQLEVRLYRDDETLVTRCSAAQPDPACHATEGAVLAVLPLEHVGVYQVVVLTGTGDWSMATGSLDADVAAAMEAGAAVETRRVEVR